MNKTMQKEKVLRTPDEIAKRQGMWLTIVALVALYVLLFALDNFLKPSKFTLMLIPVLKKGAIYSLLCVSMNLLNGFTGLFSLGQAGFMLIGAYTYAILTIPVDQRAVVYQYYDGGLVQFALPVIPALILAGLCAEGETIIDDTGGHIARGYDKIEEKLANVGGYVKRLS